MARLIDTGRRAGSDAEVAGAQRGRASYRVRTALFVDVDNIFGSLHSLDRKAALAFFDDPMLLLKRLRSIALGPGERRDLLVRRAYLNPNGSVPDQERGKANGRLYFSKLRPNLIQAGFEVIDCPALTAKQKNAADIRIVIDALTILNNRNSFDEIAIASSDSDFTPLLHRIRAEDRRTLIVSAGNASPAYQSVADVYVDDVTLVALLTEPDPLEDVESTDLGAGDEDALGALLRKTIREASEPISLAELGTQAHADFGTVITETSWFGQGGLTQFILSLGDSDLEVDKRYAWNGTRHTPPDTDEAAETDLPAIVRQLARIVGMPRFDTTVWPQIFELLEAYMATHEFALSECTAWVRDAMNERECPVGRRPIGSVVRGASLGQEDLFAKATPPKAIDIFEAYLAWTLDQAQAGELALDEDEQQELRAWLWPPGTTRPILDQEPPADETAATQETPSSAHGW